LEQVILEFFLAAEFSDLLNMFKISIASIFWTFFYFRRAQRVPAEKPSENRLDTIRVGLSYYYLCLQLLEEVGLLVGVGRMCLPS
jgi:hypothetical protein